VNTYNTDSNLNLAGQVEGYYNAATQFDSAAEYFSQISAQVFTTQQTVSVDPTQQDVPAQTNFSQVPAQVLATQHLGSLDPRQQDIAGQSNFSKVPAQVFTTQQIGSVYPVQQDIAAQSNIQYYSQVPDQYSQMKS